MKQTVEKERSPPDRLRRSLLPPPSCCSLNGCTCRWQQQVQVNTKKTHRIMHVELYLKTLCQLWFEAMRATYNEVEGASLVIEGQPARKAALTQ